MQTNLAPWAQASELGREADAILRKCVHCGFCTATCPTYQLLGDELDGPRGRIYLIKEVLEGAQPTHETQLHLDRCLTCRNCETTCPSGVKYGELIDIGRTLVDERVKRRPADVLRRRALDVLLHPRVFSLALKVGRLLRPLLPRMLAAKVQAVRPVGSLPDTRALPTQVWLLAGCVQPAMMPSIDAATCRVLAAVGVGASVAPDSGCCGAVDFHMGRTEGALDKMRRNIDAWWPAIAEGRIHAVVMNASGCGATVKEYGHHLRHDPVYAERARELSARVVDISEMLEPYADVLAPQLRPEAQSMAFHPPCTLQHWQSLGGQTDGLLRKLGFDLKPFAEQHLCCGSAGAYSLLQPAIAGGLRERKLAAITPTGATTILSANVGCIGHLQGGTPIPVVHWIEAVDARLQGVK